MPSGITRQYAPDNVTVALGTQSISGFLEGTFVEIEKDVDTGTISVGSDGEATLLISPNQAGKIKLTLQQASPSNDYLNTLYQALQNKQMSTAVQAFTLNDKNGDTTVTAQQTVVSKPAKVTFADKPEGREWTLITGYIDMENGGENSISG